MREVLRRAAQHRGPADVDHLDGFLLAHAVAAGDFAERIEVDADDVERTDLLLVQVCDVVGVVAAREDRCVDVGVKRLDAPAEHLGDTGQLLDPLDVQADFVLEEVCGAAARDQLATQVGEPAREILQAGLVVDGDQCAHSSLTTSGRIRCSTAWIRSTSVSRGSTADGLLADHRAGVEPFVDVVDGDAGRLDARGQRVVDRPRAGELRQQRRVDVDDAVGEAIEERRA